MNGSPLKIALFASQFYPHAGGVEELVRQLALALRRRGHDAIVVTNRWPRDLPTWEEFEGIPLHRVAFRRPASNWKSKISFPLSQRLIQNQVNTILRRHSTQIIHVQCVASNAFYALGAHRALGLPLFITTQGERTMDANRIYERSAWQNAVLRDSLAAAAHITACSRDTLRDVEKYFGLDFGARASVIPNGIRLVDFAQIAPFVHPRPYIFAIGRLVEQKGFDALIRAFQRANLSEVDLILAGEGPEKAPLERLVEEKNLAGRVHFVGQASRAQAASLFLGCLFFVLPSRMEPQGIVNLEAMAAGKAVAASRVGGVPEIVLDGQTGLLFDSENEAEIAATLQKLSQDAELRNQLGAAGRAHAEKFDWEEITDEYEKIYRRLRA